MLIVAKFPPGIFFLTAAAVLTSFTALSLVRLAKPGVVDYEDLPPTLDEQEDVTGDPNVPIIVVDVPNSKPSSPSL